MLRNIHRTDTLKWWLYQGWILGFNDFNGDKPKIGIESYYQIDGENPPAEFVIFITAWKLEDWACYEAEIQKQYPNSELIKEDNRAFLCVDIIKEDNQELIVESLKKHYDYLSTLTSNG